MSLSLSPSKGQYYHAIEVKREYYDNVVTVPACSNLTKSW